MLLIQLTGLSGAGKSTLSRIVKQQLQKDGFTVEILDGDQLRKSMNKDLGFSKNDRLENIRRLGALAYSLLSQRNVIIIAAINPFEETRKELEKKYGAKTIWISCAIEILVKRDPKGLYKKAMLPNDHPDKISNLSGINDAYEEPVNADLVIDTATEPVEESAKKLMDFIRRSINTNSPAL
jgi:adenylylsulfate kinase